MWNVKKSSTPNRLELFRMSSLLVTSSEVHQFPLAANERARSVSPHCPFDQRRRLNATSTHINLRTGHLPRVRDELPTRQTKGVDNTNACVVTALFIMINDPVF